MKIATNILSAALPLVVLGWLLDLHGRLGLLVYTEQMLALVFGLSLALAFLLRSPAGGKRDEGTSIALPDQAAVVLSLATAGYVALAYPRISETIYLQPTDAVIAGILLVLLTLEALRRMIGWGITSILLIALAYALFGHLLPSVLQARKNPVDSLAIYLSMDSNGMFGIPLAVSATTVLIFVMFGTLLTRSGGGQFFTDAAMSGLGRFRGGAAKMSIVASALFGSMSGSAVANVASTGVVTIPLMRRSGYDARSASAVEAVVSTGGQLMPPVMGAAAFLMAELLQVSYATVVMAALLPALFYYIVVFIQVDLQAARDGIRALSEDDTPDMRRTLAGGWPFLIPFAVLLGGLFLFSLRPEDAALYACASVLLVGLLHRYGEFHITIRDIPALLQATGRASVEIILIGAAAGLVVGVLNVTALSFSLTLHLVGLAGGQMFILLVIAAVLAIVLGMGMPTVSVYILLAALLAPSLVQMGANEISAHLFVQYFGLLSMLTPPVAMAAFTAAIIGQTKPMAVALRSMRYGWAAFVMPFLFVADPALTMQGDWGDIALVALRTLAGLWLVSSAVVGYLGGSLRPGWRVVTLLAGAQALIPLPMLPMPTSIGLASLALAIIVFMLRRGTGPAGLSAARGGSGRP
ncbi:MAG: TRAP transporter permease [Pseudooceanicola atlanticus]